MHRKESWDYRNNLANTSKLLYEHNKFTIPVVIAKISIIFYDCIHNKKSHPGGAIHNEPTNTYDLVYPRYLYFA